MSTPGNAAKEVREALRCAQFALPTGPLSTEASALCRDLLRQCDQTLTFEEFLLVDMGGAPGEGGGNYWPRSSQASRIAALQRFRSGLQKVAAPGG